MSQVKIVSQLNAQGVFVGEVVAHESPLEPGVFLLPGGAVDAAPPSVPEGNQAVWNGVAFDIVDAPSNQPDASAPPTIDEVRKMITLERDKRMQLGGYRVGQKWFHSDIFSRTQQLGLVMLGANIPENTPWKTMDGSFVVMTQTLAAQVFSAAAASDIAIFNASEAHKTAMENSATPSDYDFSGGWPVGFYG